MHARPGAGSQRLLRLLVVLLHAHLIGACTSVHIYDKGLDQVAQRTKAQADAVELGSVIDTARTNHGKRLDAQVKLLRRSKELEGKIRLAHVVARPEPLATTLWSSEAFTRRLGALGVTDSGAGATLEAISRLRQRFYRLERRLLERARRVEIYLGIMPTPCLPAFSIPDLGDETGKHLLDAVPENEHAEFELIYNDYRATCLGTSDTPGVQGDVQGVVSALSDGLIVREWESWRTHAESVEVLRAAARDRLVALRKAERDFDAAAGSAAKDSKAAKDALDSARDNLKTAVKAFETACNVGASIGKEATAVRGNPFSVAKLCEKQRSTVSTLIEAFATGDTTTSEDADPATKRAATVAAALPGLLQSTADAIAKGRAVPVAHLRLLKLQAAVDLEFAERAVERQEARVGFARGRWFAALDEGHHLWMARRALCEASAVVAGHDPDSTEKQVACATFEVQLDDSRNLTGCAFKFKRWHVNADGIDVFDVPADAAPESLAADACLVTAKSYSQAKGVSGASDRVKNAAAHFALAARSGEADLAEARFRLRAVDRQAALDADERALRLWTNLIVVPVNSLSAYYASGLRAESIAEVVVSGAALGAIAAGVN